MPYYGTGSSGGGEGGGTNDHRLLGGRSDANQHPAAAISVTTIGPLGAGAGNVQQALETLAETGGWTEINPTAAVPIGAFKAVAFRPDGLLEPADHDNAVHPSRLAGVTLASAISGTAARVCAGGLARFNGWTWTPGASVFVGRNGDLTQTVPVTGFAQPIGNALGPDAIQVRIGQPVRRDA